MSLNYEAFFDNGLVNTQNEDIWELQLIEAWTRIKSRMYLMHIFTDLRGMSYNFWTNIIRSSGHSVM